MKYDVLYNFISPITGRVLSNPDYVLVGDKDGIATPSPILIDMRLDMIDFRHDLDSFAASSFIISTANSLFPNAQALSSLTDGFMVNTGGIVSTTNIVPLPSLTYKNIWIGNINNNPVASQTITIDNFPSLGMPLVPVPDPTHGDLVGNVWEGTISGRPVESGRMASMFADLILINARFATANFIMGHGNIVLKTVMPASQFLDTLTAGALVQTSTLGNGKLVSFIVQQDQVLMGGVNNAPESRARIGVENLPLLAQNRIWIGDVNSIPQSTQVIDISNLPVLNANNLWIGGVDNRPTPQPTIAIGNLPNLNNGYVWQGDATNRPVEVQLNFAPNDASYILKTPNNNLNSAQALSELAGGILKSAALTGTISIASGGGTVGVDDYVTPAVLTEEIEGVIAEATEAGSVAGGEAGTAAGTAAATAEIAAAMPAILVEAGTAGGTAGGIAGGAAGTAAAALVLFAKESTSDHNADISEVNTRIDNLHIPPSNAKYILNQQASGLSQAQVLSDLIGGNYPNGGLLKVTSIDGIIKIASPTVDYADPNKENTFLEKIDFQKDVRFLSKGAIKIPVGNSNERPSNSQVGMVRYNTDL